MRARSVVVVVLILVVYFIFTSGFVYEITGCDATNAIVVPYSFGLSAERTGLVGVFTKNDMACMEWLEKTYTNDYTVVADYNVSRLIYAYIPSIYMAHKIVSEYVAPPTFKDIPEHSYIFISEWNYRHDKYIEGVGIGLREMHDLPLLNYPVAFRSGNAIIYVNE
jgi:uncharacterized membrane protein